MEFAGSMFWRTVNATDYLIRSLPGAQQSLGPRTPGTQEMYRTFRNRKAVLDDRVASLEKKRDKAVRMNRALHVGRVEPMVVDILNGIHSAALDQSLIVIGTNARYAYESAAGVRIAARHLAIDTRQAPWDDRTHLSLATRDRIQPSWLLAILKQADRSFELRSSGASCTAVNRMGYQVELLRREGTGIDNAPGRHRDGDGDFWAATSRDVDWLLRAPKFSAMVVAANGTMANMTTVDPRAFVLHTMWMAGLAERDPIQATRAASQARVVRHLIEEYLPQPSFGATTPFPAVRRRASSSLPRMP